MTKPTLVHVCSKCDAQFVRWTGRCESCGSWGTVGKEPVALGQENPTSDAALPIMDLKISSFAKLENNNTTYMPTGYAPLDGVLCGGLTRGAAILIAGEPGMGKSTLLAQVALAMATDNQSVLYVAGEESPSQIGTRLGRLSPTLPTSLSYLDDTRTASVISAVERLKPALCIVDSIQTVSSEQASGEAGGVNQVRACAAQLTQAAKRTGVPIILVGQVTKDGDIAGPRLMEHVVDTVLSLEGDRTHRFRILRAIKNRFGSADEVALLDMTEKGLVALENPSGTLLADRSDAPGSAIGCVLEGRRPLMAELQALVTAAGYSAPVRKATGFDTSRLNMLLAVLTRHAGIGVYDKDVFANAAGGIAVRDPAADLTMAAAIASAVLKKPLDPKTALFGEIGLTGELRPVPLTELRLKEIARLGFTNVICPASGRQPQNKDLELRTCRTVRDALERAFRSL